MALKAVESASTMELVSAQLAEELSSGRWPVGSKIPGEWALAEQLQVSRPLVREAIRGLTRLGMLEPRRGSGTFVRSTVSPVAMLVGLDRAEVREIFEVQMAYDVQAAGLAARRRSDEGLLELERLLLRRDDAENDRADPQRFAVDDAAFHMAVVELSGNPLLVEFYRYFITRLREGLRHVHADLNVPSCGHSSHRAVVDAIAARDVDGARRAAHDVVDMALRALDGSSGR